jgi:hypothetical protein
MVAAAITLWTMFSLWLIAPTVGMPETTARIAITLSAVEFVMLLVWSYGVESCADETCAPLAQAAGVAARTDVPALAVAFVAFTLLQCAGVRSRRTARRRRATSPAAGRPNAAGEAWPPASSRSDAGRQHRS